MDSHWMKKEGGGYNLMKHEGKFKLHKGSQASNIQETQSINYMKALFAVLPEQQA